MRVSSTIFGTSGFRLRVSRDSSKSSEWTPRVNAAVFQILSVSFTNYDIGALTRAADSIYEEYLDILATDSKWADAVTKSTGDSTRIEYGFEAWNTRLRELMRSFPANDVTRAFTKALKR
jgi:hypothetical protein